MTRFLSILFIVALGSGFMAGLAATSPDMYDTADKYMDENNWFDLDIKSTLGFTADDVAAVASDADVKEAIGTNVFDIVLACGDTEYTCRVFATLCDAENPMNGVVLKEGRMPENDGECLAQITMGRYFDGDIKIGDVLTLSGDNKNYDILDGCIKKNSLTVVGFVESPMCISITAEPSTVGTGRIALDIYTAADFFKTDYFTDIFVTLKGAAELDAFGDEYEDLINGRLSSIEALGDERMKIRRDSIKETARESMAFLQKAAMLAAQIKSAGTMPDTAAIKQIYENAAAAVLTASGEPALASLLPQTEKAVAEGISDAGGLEALASAIAADIKAADNMTGEVSEVSWILRTRYDNTGFSAYDSNVGKVSALSKIFPAFFFMVALLVALTTMTRLVEENRAQIGTLKALGFTNGQILREYMFYSLLSSVLGCALGFAVGFRLFPRAISSAYSMMFILPETQTPFRADIALWVAPVTVGSILLASFLACHAEYKASPAALMQPKAPAAGKRIFLEHLPFIWKKLSFTHKVTCRNLFRYKKRFFMTVIGVAGCSALLLTGFGLRDSVSDIVDKQFGEIYKYELTLMTGGEEAMQSDDALAALLSDKSLVSDKMDFFEENAKAGEAVKTESIKICVPSEPSRTENFIALRNRKSGEAIAFPENGTVLTEKLCEKLGISVGDTVTLENADGKKGTVTVAGITENYISSYAYMNAATYESAFGTSPEFSHVMCRLAGNADANDATGRFMNCESVVFANSSVSLKNSFSDSIKSINGVILTLILAAGLLCMVTLYNLTNVNICERRKELATIRVLGFHKREVENYIFRETNILSFIGAAAGLLVGVWLHSFVVRTVEVDQVMFGRSIYPMSYIYALAISVAFTLLVNIVMRGKIRSIDMVEAMKAND